MVKFKAWNRLERGKISSIYWHLKETPKRRVRIYATDGYTTRLLGRYKQSELEDLADQYLGERISSKLTTKEV